MKKTAPLYNTSSSEGEELGFAKSRIEELQSRELEIELESALAIERARAGFLEREISSLEIGKQRFEDLVREYERAVQRLELASLGNELLEGKVRRLMRKVTGQERVIQMKDEKIGEMEAEVLKCLDELETKGDLIERLTEEVEKLKEEKDDLIVKLSLEEKAAASSQHNEELALVEDYKRLAKELDEALTNQAAETTELTYLRWTNACLRHELMRSYQLQQQLRSEFHDEDEEKEQGQHNTSEPSSPDDHHHHSRRKKLMHKLKKWVEDHQNNHFHHLKKNKEASNTNKCIGWMPVHHHGDLDPVS
ncbi:Protein CHUP1, chloroplastic [Linum perenne]